ncbi:hypothetical protein D3C78_1961910 [compost metagenome]
MHHEDPEHFAEKLADLWRGDEITRTAEGFATLVITVFRIGEAERKIVGNAERTIEPDK